MEDIIKQIKQELKNRKLTYEDFTKMCNISISGLQKIFSNNIISPRIDTINAMLEALDMNKYEKTPQGTFLTTQEQCIVDLLITCSEHQQHLVQAYIEGLKSKGNIANQKIELNKDQNKNLG